MKQLTFLCLFICLSITGQNKPQWMRYSSISPDGSQIVFTYKGDLYKVPSNGGNATQLTFHKAHDYKAVWSKDGTKIAFASNRYGNFDIFVMSANGGNATRLTFHSANESPYSFSSNNKEVLFGTTRQDEVKHRQYPTGSQPELYSVPVKGGRVSQVFTIPVEYVQVSKNGKTMIYHDKKGGENEFRKHHTSSITRDIWMYDAKTYSHKMITSFAGEDRQPVFTSDAKGMSYLSDHSGNFHVHSLNFDTPTTNQQLTKYKTHPVRFLSMGNGILSFGYDGELYTMKEGQSPKKVNVKIITQNIDNSDKYVSING